MLSDTSCRSLSVRAMRQEREDRVFAAQDHEFGCIYIGKKTGDLSHPRSCSEPDGIMTGRWNCDKFVLSDSVCRQSAGVERRFPPRFLSPGVSQRRHGCESTYRYIEHLLSPELFRPPFDTDYPFRCKAILSVREGRNQWLRRPKLRNSGF